MNIKTTKLKEMLFEAVEQLPIMIEYEKIRAKQTRAKYQALIETGFTKEEALELCKS